MNRISRTLFRSLLRWNRQSVVHNVPFWFQPSHFGIEDFLPKNVTIAGPEGVQATIFHCFRTQKYSDKNIDIALNALKKLNELSSSMKGRLEQQKANLDIPIASEDHFFRLGQVVQLKKSKIRAVVVGWKYDSAEGKQKVSLVYDDHDFSEFVSPNEQMVVTVPADELQLVTDHHLKRVDNAAIKTYFSHFDSATGRYVPQEDVAFLHPLDLQGVDFNPQVLSKQGALAAKRTYKDLLVLQGEIQKVFEKFFPGILQHDDGSVGPAPSDDVIHVHTIVRHVLGELMTQIKDFVPGTDEMLPPSASATTFARRLQGRRSLPSTPSPSLETVLRIRSLQENIPLTHTAVFNALYRFSEVIFNVGQMLSLRFQTKGLAYIDALYLENNVVKVRDVHPKLQRHLVRTTLPSPEFHVGQVVQHKQFGYRGVVVGYDMRPLQDVSHWEGVVNLPLGQEQVFYKIVPDDRDVHHRRTYYYVAQENLYLVEESSKKLVQHKELKKYFVGYDVEQGVFIVPHKLKYCFPKGDHEFSDKYPEHTVTQAYCEKYGITSLEELQEPQEVDGKGLEDLKRRIVGQEIAVYENIDKCLLTVRDLIRDYLLNFIQVVPNAVVQTSNRWEEDSMDDSDEIVHPPPLSFYATRHTQDLLQLLGEAPTREAALGIENFMWSAHVLSTNHNAMIAMRLGISELRRRNVSQAVRHFKRSLEFDANYVEAYNKLAVCYQSVGEYDRCKEEGQKAVKLMPHHYGACAGIALAYEKKGDKDKAIHYLRRVLDVHPWAANIPTVLLTVQGKKGKGGGAETKDI